MLNEKKTIPGHLTPLAMLLGPIEITGTPREKMDGEKQKRSDAFHALGWTVPVQAIRGYEDKQLPTGQVIENVPMYDENIKNITIWSNEYPEVLPGTYVLLEQPMCGAYSGNLYIQCLGLSPYDANENGEEFSLDRMLNEED